MFLRHLLDDHATFSPACRELIRRLERGDLRGWTTDLVIAEVVFVLTGPARQRSITRNEILDNVLPLTQLVGLETPSKQLWPRVFDLYTSANVDFVDAYNAAQALDRGETDVVSYDGDFDQLPGLRRRDPGA